MGRRTHGLAIVSFSLVVAAACSAGPTSTAIPTQTSTATATARTARPSSTPAATTPASATPSPAPTTPSATASLEPGKLSAAITTDLGPCAIAELDGSAWVTNLNASTLSRIDGVTNAVDEGVNVGTQPCAIVGDNEALWIGALGDKTLVRFDPASGTVTDRLDVAGPVWDVQFGHGSIWASVQLAETLLRIDPETREIIETWDVGAQPSGLAVTPTEVWLATSLGTVMRINPATNGRLPDIIVEGDPTWFASAPDSVLLTLSNAESVSVFDAASSDVISSFGLRQHPRDPGFVGGNFWVTANGPNRVVVVRPTSGDVLGEFAVPDANAIWTAEGLLGDGWVLDFSDQTVFRFEADSGL